MSSLHKPVIGRVAPEQLIDSFVYCQKKGTRPFNLYFLQFPYNNVEHRCGTNRLRHFHMDYRGKKEKKKRKERKCPFYFVWYKRSYQILHFLYVKFVSLPCLWCILTVSGYHRFVMLSLIKGTIQIFYTHTKRQKLPFLKFKKTIFTFFNVFKADSECER